uniref:Conotoxin n=1 Tax=Conus praecellens TaxID=128530 RepID=A0A291C284_CONPC|nr:conotoxin [Conus praecellens]
MTMNMSMTLIAFAMVVMASSVIGSIPRQCKGKDLPCGNKRYHECCRQAMWDCWEPCMWFKTHWKCWSHCYGLAARKFGCNPSDHGCCPKFLEKMSECLMKGSPTDECWSKTKSVPCR